MLEPDRRANPRYPLRVFATLSVTQQDQKNSWSVHLLDISLQGAKLAVLDEHELLKGDSVELSLELPPLDLQQGPVQSIELVGKIVHCQEHILGIEYSPADEIEAENLSALIKSLS